MVWILTSEIQEPGLEWVAVGVPSHAASKLAE
jgi:hypothetical protein